MVSPRRLLDSVPEQLRPYLAIFVAWLLCLLVSIGLLQFLGTLGAAVAVLLFLLLIVAAAWMGYGVGMAACGLSLLLLIRMIRSGPEFAPLLSELTVHPSWRFGMVGILALLISRIAAGKRNTEAVLRSAAATLEKRVEERTGELVRREQQLQEQAQLLDLATDAIVVKDKNGLIRFWSDGATELYGWTREEAAGKNADELLHTQFPEPLETMEATLLANGAWQGELTHQRRDGRILTVMSRWALRRDSHGKPSGSLEINTDITARRRMEEQLRQAQKMEAIGRLAGGIAHDFNNILTVVNGYAEMALQEAWTQNDVRDAMTEISAAGRRAADVTQGLLAFSRRQLLKPAVVNLNSVIQRIEKMLRRLLGEDIQLVTALGEDAWEVLIDQSQLEQIIINLAVNARDAMPNGGKLTIETSYVVLDEEYCRAHLGVNAGDYALLAVSDTGHGMDESTRRQIFEPFFTTKPVGKGTGLGLATVYGIVQQSGGAITVYSEPGRGATFKTYLPRTAAAAATGHVERTEVTPAAVRPGTTILLVEDDDGLRKLAHTILESRGFRVLTASSGAEALEIFRRSPLEIDLILSDLVMPQMSGQQLAIEVRRVYPPAKIVFMSGYSEHAVLDQLVRDPTVSFVGKPFTATGLVNVVHRTLAAG
jgi:PAS domain S-box-containing protein